MRPPPSVHSHFFSSLKWVEKRLKLDNPSQPSTHPSPPTPPPPPLPPPESSYTATESLSSPIYLNVDQSTVSTSTLQESEPPQEFLSNSPDFPPTHEDPPQSNTLQNPQTINEVEDFGIDEIELLIQLLGLSDFKEEEEQRVGFGLNCGGGGNCDCDDGFLGKIVGVKGPKCGKEIERLEGWIRHFMNGDCKDERREPLRLAHLLLGKAAFVSEGSDGFGGFEFPSTVEEFLQNDPPTN